jgi:signal transduction histidine kinase
MPVDPSTLALIPFATALLTSLVALLLLQRYQSPTAPAATLLFAGISVWLFAESLALEMTDLDDRIFVSKLIYPGVVAVPVAVLLFSARATRRDAWITPRRLAALWVMPFVTLLLVATNGFHHWIWTRIGLENTSAGEQLVFTHGPGFVVTIVYAYALLAASMGLLLSRYRRDWQRYRTEAPLVLVGLSAPWIANAIYVTGHSPLGNLDLTPYGFTVTAVFLSWGLIRQGILEATPVSRSTVVQELGDALVVIDRRGRVVDVNAAARDVLGAPDAAVREVQAQEVLASFPELLALLARPEDEASSTVEIATSKGIRSFDARVSDLREPGRDRIAGRMVVLRDVTDYLRASEAARAATVAKSQFLANMSHEIRTPMNGVLGLTEYLSGLPLEAEQRSVVEDILRSGTALLQVIDDILDFSKLEAGKLRIDPLAFSPRELVHEVVKLLQPRARQTGISLESAIGADVPAWLVGDNGRIRQVLCNLASNAVKFTREGGVALRLRCDAREGPIARMRFEVVDTGIGIPADALETIFDAFTQADASTTRSFGGTGLGLAISRELVTCMGGELGVASEPDKGSTFWFTLPLPVCEEPVAAHRATAMAEPPRPARKRRLRVLAAEDNPVNQRVLMRFLERLGCSVELASDGREAVERVKAGQYDVVLMDCQMPVLDGFGATREIRASGGPGARVPIVAVTAHALPGDRERCLEQGMDDYLTKPLRMEDLERVLARWPT